MRDEGIGAGGLLLAFVAGAVTGAAVALLFAPAAGEQTREYLEQRAREGRDKAGEFAQKGREILERQRDQIVTAIDRGREAYKQARNPEEPV